MMMLARMIMYFCGDPESWDHAQLDDRHDGRRYGRRHGRRQWAAWAAAWVAAWAAACVPSRRPACRSPTLAPSQTRHLPTRLVSLSPPDPEEGLILPAGRARSSRILGDVAKVNDNPRVQKALRRLAAAKAPDVALATGHVAGRRGPGLEHDRPVVADVGQPLRADPGQGFRRPSRRR